MSADVRAGRILYLKNIISGEDLSSQIDGIVNQFTLANDFYEDSVKVYLNGLRQQEGIGKDFITVSPNIIEFNYILEVDDILLVDYVKK